MDLSIALVNWNNKVFLRQCLESIEAAQLSHSYEVVVADNCSTDGSRKMLSERFPYVRLVRNETNVGVARGNNQCILNSTGRYVFILNNDTTVNRHSIETMLEFLDQHPEAGAVGGNLVNPDGTFQSSYYSFPTLWEEFLLVSHIGRLSNPYFPSHNGYGKSVRVVDWISSASIIVRRAAIEAIDLVDEDFFIYSDETDWQYRMRQAGWKVYYLPEAITVHYGGGSFEPGGKRYTLVYRGRMLFAQKHYGRFYSFAQRTLFATAALCRAGIWSLLRASPKWQAAARKQIPSNLETLKICLCLRRPI